MHELQDNLRLLFFSFLKETIRGKYSIFFGLFLIVGINVKRFIINGKAKYADSKIKLLHCIKFDQSQMKES